MFRTLAIRCTCLVALAGVTLFSVACGSKSDDPFEGIRTARPVSESFDASALQEGRGYTHRLTFDEAAGDTVHFMDADGARVSFKKGGDLDLSRHKAGRVYAVSYRYAGGGDVVGIAHAVE